MAMSMIRAYTLPCQRIATPNVGMLKKLQSERAALVLQPSRDH